MPVRARRADAAMACQPRAEPLEALGERLLFRGRLHGIDPAGLSEIAEKPANFRPVGGPGRLRPLTRKHAGDRTDELSPPEPCEHIRVQVTQADPPQMEPDNETGACVTVGPDRFASKAIAMQPLEERVEDAQVVVRIAGLLDASRPLREAHEFHDLRRGPALAPGVEQGRSRHSGTTVAIVLQEAVEDRAVDRPERDAAAREPRQEVTGRPWMLNDVAVGNPLAAEFADELLDDRIEPGLLGGRRQPVGERRWHLSSLMSLRDRTTLS